MKANVQPTVLILGANGRLGHAAVRAFASAGWGVLAQARRAPASLPVGARYLATPLEDGVGLSAAAAGARAVVYAVNQPYPQWAKHALPQARQGMDVAQRLGATFMFPGNVYNFGAGMPALLDVDTPQEATTKKGYIRVAIEQEMRARAGWGLRSVVIRAGDFFGAGTGSWFDLVIVKSLAQGKLSYAGPLDRAHAWAYLPDLARAFVGVAERADALPEFANLHFPGHTLTGEELLNAIERAAAALSLQRAGGLRRASLPWGWIRALRWLVPAWREIVELSYLFEVPHELNGEALRRQVGTLQITPIAIALTATLIVLGLAPAHDQLGVKLTPPDGA
ncbi:MAG: NAD-dependent epimerase/dehydratase family protein [Burkholderiaceae bacterium]